MLSSAESTPGAGPARSTAASSCRGQPVDASARNSLLTSSPVFQTLLMPLLLWAAFMLSSVEAAAGADVADELVCANRLHNRSRLDALVRRQSVYRLEAERAQAVGYDQRRHSGFQGNDQGSNHHDYYFTYERLLYGLPRNLSMLNIGILDGHSLLNYADFFGARATVVGLDISTALWKDKAASAAMAHAHAHDRAKIQVVEADSTDTGTWVRLRREFPAGFQLIVDDGCHKPGCLHSTLEYAWPSLSPGGIYIAEDTFPIRLVTALIQQIQYKPKGARRRSEAFHSANGSLSAATVDTITIGDGFFSLTKYNPHEE